MCNVQHDMNYATSSSLLYYATGAILIQILVIASIGLHSTVVST